MHHVWSFYQSIQSLIDTDRHIVAGIGTFFPPIAAQQKKWKDDEASHDESAKHAKVVHRRALETCDCDVSVNNSRELLVCESIKASL